MKGLYSQEQSCAVGLRDSCMRDAQYANVLGVLGVQSVVQWKE